jgi:cell division cycle 14
MTRFRPSLEILTHSGTLAGVYLIKRFSFSGEEALGWLRCVRPGSVMGPQQKYLLDYGREQTNGFAKKQISRPKKWKANTVRRMR